MLEAADSRIKGRAIRKQLAERLWAVVRELYGEDGVPRLAALLDLPVRTLLNYEAGCTIPGETLLAIIRLTGVHPDWLTTGRGPKFLPRVPEDSGADQDGVPMSARPDRLAARRVGAPSGLAN